MNDEQAKYDDEYVDSLLKQYRSRRAELMLPVHSQRTKLCPSLLRFNDIFAHGDPMTEEEESHFKSDCSYCQKTIAMVKQQLVQENAGREPALVDFDDEDWDEELNFSPIDEQPTPAFKLSSPDTSNAAIPRDDKANTVFAIKRSRPLEIGAAAALLIVLGVAWAFFHKDFTGSGSHRGRQEFVADRHPVLRPQAFSDGPGVQVALSKRSINVEGLPAGQSLLIHKALTGEATGEMLPATNLAVGPRAGGGTSGQTRAPRHLQPAGSVVVGPPDFRWTRAEHFNSREYRIECGRFGPHSEPVSDYKTLGIVQASSTHLMARQLLPPGEYGWHVRVIGTGRPDVPSEFVSANANFVVVAPEFAASDMVLGVAYAQVGQWKKAEARFRHLMQPQASDINGAAAAAARKAVGSTLLRWLQNQRQSVRKATSVAEG